MEGHRYADDPEPSWYTGPGQQPGPGQYARSTDPDVSGSHAVGPYESGIHERPSGAFRLPDQRPAVDSYAPAVDPYAMPDPVTSTGSHARPGARPEARAAYDSVRIPVRGPEYPTIRPTGPDPASVAPASSAPAAAPTPMTEPTSLVPPVTPRQADSVYQARRPKTSFLVAAVMVVLVLPVVRLLLQATFTGTPTASSIVPAVLLALGFALTGIGLFAVAGGRPLGRDAWLRPPVAYLPVGLILLVAAGLAAA